jgi:hypothetical protein
MVIGSLPFTDGVRLSMGVKTLIARSVGEKSEIRKMRTP